MAEKRLSIYFLSINVKIVKMLKEFIFARVHIAAGRISQVRPLKGNSDVGWVAILQK